LSHLPGPAGCGSRESGSEEGGSGEDGSSSSSFLLSSLELSDAKVYEPCIRALLGTASEFCEVVVLKLRTTYQGRRGAVQDKTVKEKASTSRAPIRGVAAAGAPELSLSRSLSLPHTLSLSPSHTLSLTLSLSHSLTLSLSHSLTLSLSRTHTLSLRVALRYAESQQRVHLNP